MRKLLLAVVVGVMLAATLTLTGGGGAPLAVPETPLSADQADANNSRCIVTAVTNSDIGVSVAFRNTHAKWGRTCQLGIGIKCYPWDFSPGLWFYRTASLNSISGGQSSLAILTRLCEANTGYPYYAGEFISWQTHGGGCNLC